MGHFLKKFTSINDYNDYKERGFLPYPNVSLNLGENEIKYNSFSMGDMEFDFYLNDVEKESTFQNFIYDLPYKTKSVRINGIECLTKMNLQEKSIKPILNYENDNFFSLKTDFMLNGNEYTNIYGDANKEYIKIDATCEKEINAFAVLKCDNEKDEKGYINEIITFNDMMFEEIESEDGKQLLVSNFSYGPTLVILHSLTHIEFWIPLCTTLPYEKITFLLGTETLFQNLNNNVEETIEEINSFNTKLNITIPEYDIIDLTKTKIKNYNTVNITFTDDAEGHITPNNYVTSIKVNPNYKKSGVWLHCSGCNLLTRIELNNYIDLTSASECLSLKGIILGEKFYYMEDYLFNGSSNLEFITSKNPTPPACSPIENGHIFEGVNKTIPIYIPKGSKNAYQNAPAWNEFTNFQEIDE